MERALMTLTIDRVIKEKLLDVSHGTRRASSRIVDEALEELFKRPEYAKLIKKKYK